MIENVLIIDTETTGLDPSKGSKCIEIAAILYNAKLKICLQSFSTFFPCEENPVEDINHIPAEATRCRMATNAIPIILSEMTHRAQAVVAHNAEFDKKFIQTLSFGQLLLEKKWICTRKDFSWPFILTKMRLQDVCHASGVNYIDAHRALKDCQLIADCFSKVPDLEFRLNSARGNSFSNGGKFR